MPCIQFTAEEETEGKLPFFDLCLQREDNGSLTTSVFGKATHTNQYLSFDSDHPVAHKASVVRTEAVRRVLRPLDIKVAFRPLCTLRHQLVHSKDHVPRDQQAGVVYQIPCSDCLKVYIGQSGRTLKHRLSEHRRALRHFRVGMWLHLLWQSTHGPLATI